MKNLNNLMFKHKMKYYAGIQNKAEKKYTKILAVMMGRG